MMESVADGVELESDGILVGDREALPDDEDPDGVEESVVWIGEGLPW